MIVTHILHLLLLLRCGKLGTFLPLYKHIQNMQAAPKCTGVPTACFVRYSLTNTKRALHLSPNLLIRYTVFSKSRSAVQDCNVNRQTRSAHISCFWLNNLRLLKIFECCHLTYILTDTTSQEKRKRLEIIVDSKSIRLLNKIKNR